MQNKYKHLLEKLQNADFFTFKFLESEVGESYAKLLVHNLERSGKIVKLAKGIYTFKKSPYMLVKALPKSYIGLGSAAFLHNVWEQATKITILSPYVSSRIKFGEREVAGFKVVLRKISEKMFFGYELKFLEEVNGWIRVSDIEKTLIDLIYLKYPFKDEILPKLLEVSDVKKIKKYLLLMKKRNVKGWRKVMEEVDLILKNLGET
jgi:predicted transcriptional regulator of viral defense system